MVLRSKSVAGGINGAGQLRCSVSLRTEGRARGLLDAAARQRIRRRATRILGAALAPLQQSGQQRGRLAPSSVPGIVCEWSVLLSDDERVRALNAAHRRKDKTTDVLSFPRPANSPLATLGDVVISVEQAKRQSRRGDLEAELVRLLVHGLCHLLGHDHGTATERRRMRVAEDRLLAPLKLRSLLADL